MAAVSVLDADVVPKARELRHPAEPWVISACIAVNALVVAAAITLVWFAAAWLERHPFVAHHGGSLRAIAIAGILALPATALGRHVRVYADRGNGLRLSSTQMALCHDLLRKACRKLGVSELPELYLVPHSDLETISGAYSVLGGRSVVALSTQLFGSQWEKNERAIAFAIGHAVGALRLGHTRWWMEMLTAYAVRLPFLRTPIRAVYAFSRDRCGAIVEPNGIVGLIIHVAEKELSTRIDVPSFVEQAMTYGGVWALVAGMNRRRPHVMFRAYQLYKAKLFDYERDIASHPDDPT
jgi:hypothetical protein